MFKSSRTNYCRTIALPIFSFLLGCMITINIIPFEWTCRIENTDREHNIMNDSKFKSPDLVIFILSAPSNSDKRQAVRNTWIKLYDKFNEDRDTNAFKIKHYFVIGNFGLNSDQLLQLRFEQSKYNDVLILPMFDSYKSLTEKIKKSFMWLSEQYDYGLSFKYLLKCDDDSFVNLKTLPRELNDIEKYYLGKDSKYSSRLNPYSAKYLSVNVQVNEQDVNGNKLQLYWGYFSGNARIKLKGKWKETGWIASDRYIPYALGGGYILSKDLVTYIAKNADDLRSFNSEDVSVGFWLAPVNNILRIHDIRFDTEWVTRGCHNINLITHNVSQQNMRKMYDNYIKFSSLCSKEVDKRSYYIYNWSVPPSQCCKPYNENVIKLK